MALVDDTNLGRLDNSHRWSVVCLQRLYSRHAEGGIAVMAKKHLVAAICCGSLLIPLSIVALYYSGDPVTQIKNTPISSLVKSGEFLTIESEVNRHKLCQTKVEPTIYDGENVRWVLSDIDYSSAPGPLGHHKYRQLVQVPSNAKEGNASLFFGILWNCPLSSIFGKQRAVIGPVSFTITK